MRAVSISVLRAGVGVDGDAHSGAEVQHLSLVVRHPTQPNLRQVHLIHEELFADLAEKGFVVAPGQIGENITTSGIDLLSLLRNSTLTIRDAVIQVTGLRNPCKQLDKYQTGLMNALRDRDAQGKWVRKAGVMGAVLEGGQVLPGDAITVSMPPEPHLALEVV